MIGYAHRGETMRMLYYMGLILLNLKIKYIMEKSMYSSSKQNNFISSSIAGGIIPIALGLALSIKKKETNKKFGYFLEI